MEALEATPTTSNSGDISNTKAPPRSTTRTASGAGSAEPSALVALGINEQAAFKRAALTNPKLSVKMPENNPIWNRFFEVASELKSLGLSRENEALVAAVMLQESNLVKANSYTRAEARTWGSYINKESDFNNYVANRPLLKSLADISLGQLDKSNPPGVKPSAKFILMFLEDVKRKIKENSGKFDTFSEEQRVKIFTVAYNAGIDTGVRAAREAGWASISASQNAYRTVITEVYEDNAKKFGIALDYSQDIYAFYSGFKSGLAAIAIPVTNRQPQPSPNRPAIPNQNDTWEKKVVEAYGAAMQAEGVQRPPKVLMSKVEVEKFQNSLRFENVPSLNIKLQKNPALALSKAVSEVVSKGLTLTVTNPSEAGLRSYDKTVELWNKRVKAGLDHWVRQNRLTRESAEQIIKLPVESQTAEILRLEEQRLYFGLEYKKSILYSVAPPGSSQHLSGLAVDIKEFDNPSIREILKKNGWFQTVKGDLPHFTYLGLSEDQLSNMGLEQEKISGQTFWVPKQRK